MHMHGSGVAQPSFCQRKIVSSRSKDYGRLKSGHHQGRGAAARYKVINMYSI